jgi:hypothetical protein
VCGWEITLHGDVPLDLIVLDWEDSQPEEAPLRELHPALAELADHPHDPTSFVEKTSGLNLYHPSISGMNLGFQSTLPEGDAGRGE